MDKILVHGGRKLNGTVRISGSKNSSLPILAAALLTKDRCVIRGVPDLSDIHYMLTILSSLGCEVERASGTVSIKAEKIRTEAPYELVRKMRASVCVLGPLLGREHEACVSLPGGCVIGDRPIDLHLRGFEALGSAVRVQGGNIKLFASALRGNTVSMRGSHGTTVLGTDNVVMAAVLADGITEIYDAAEEPEVVDLANFLNSMGAKITGAGTRHITIEGVKELHGTDYHVIPDRIEAGTMLVAGAIAGEKLTVDHVRPDHLGAIIGPLQQAGFHLQAAAKSVTISPNGATKPLHLETSPYPGFPTDMQAQMCALLVRAPGVSVITDHVFPQRFMHVAELTRMGAQIKLSHPTAVITGNGHLSGAPVMASDLRASAALLLAGLAAEGVTEINRVYHIDRGYEHIDEKLNDVGAHIERVQA